MKVAILVLVILPTLLLSRLFRSDDSSPQLSRVPFEIIRCFFTCVYYKFGTLFALYSVIGIILQGYNELKNAQVKSNEREEQLREVRARIKTLEKELINQERTLNKTEEALNKSREEAKQDKILVRITYEHKKELEANISLLEAQLQSVESSKCEMEKQLADYVDKSDATIKDLKKQLVVANSDKATTIRYVSDITKKLTEHTNECSAVKQQLVELKNEYDAIIMHLKKQLEVVNSEKAIAIQQVSDIKKQLTTSEQSTQRLHNNADKLHAELASEKKQKEELKAAYKTQLQAATILQSANASLRDEVKKYKKQDQDRCKNLRDAQGQVEALRKYIQQETNAHNQSKAEHKEQIQNFIRKVVALHQVLRTQQQQYVTETTRSEELAKQNADMRHELDTILKLVPEFANIGKKAPIEDQVRMDVPLLDLAAPTADEVSSAVKAKVANPHMLINLHESIRPFVPLQASKQS